MKVDAMSALRLFLSHSDSFAGTTNKLGSRVLCGCGIVAAIFFSSLVPAGMQAQTTSTVGSGFNQPFGLAVDKDGDVFVADYGNNAVKEIMAGTGGAASGTVNDASTVITVGSGFTNPQCVAVDGSGNVFVIEFHKNAVKEIVAGTGGAASGTVNSSSTVNIVASGFNDPEGLAVDGKGNVFVTDYGNSAVKEIVAVNGVVPTTSKTITVGIGYSNPRGIAVDARGDVFVADFNNHLLKEIMAGTGDAASGTVNTSSSVENVGSGFEYPEGVAVDRSGDVFVAYSGKSVSGLSYSMMKEIVANASGVSSNSPVITVVGSGFSALYGVAVDGNGNVFAVDPSKNAVKKIQPAR
jgi:sugar lactone lactonase YvrE